MLPEKTKTDPCFASNCQVYNARKRGGDNATQYFARTENIAGVKDMRHQELMPDVLHWLGIKKIDNVSRYPVRRGCLERIELTWFVRHSGGFFPQR